MGERSLKVALVDPVGGHGGMDFYDYGLAYGLAENGVEVVYYTSSQTNVGEFQNVDTCLCFQDIWNASNKSIKLLNFLLGYLKAFKSAKSQGIKVVHFQFFDLGLLNFLVMKMAALFRFENILTLHDVSSFKSKQSGKLEKLVLNHFSKIIVHNDLSFQELKEKTSSDSLIKIIPHGNYLPFVEEIPYQPKSSEPLRLLFFGQIKKVKGLKLLLRALAAALKENPNIYLTIAGKPWHEDLKKYGEMIRSPELVNNVTAYFDYIPNEEVSNLFKNTDLVVLPYKKIYQSGVLLLAMSYGRVALTSNLPAFKEVIEDGVTGLLFKKNNSDSLKDQILYVAQHKHELITMRENASDLLKDKFDWKTIGKKTKMIYLSHIN
mgnify:CR=1 FL=1